MKKSVKTQLLEFLQTNRTSFASGQLQKMNWLNMDGTSALPRTAVRRLQELRHQGLISGELVKGHEHYSADPPKPKLRQVVSVVGGVAHIRYE